MLVQAVSSNTLRRALLASGQWRMQRGGKGKGKGLGRKSGMEHAAHRCTAGVAALVHCEAATAVEGICFFDCRGLKRRVQSTAEHRPAGQDRCARGTMHRTTSSHHSPDCPLHTGPPMRRIPRARQDHRTAQEPMLGGAGAGSSVGRAVHCCGSRVEPLRLPMRNANLRLGRNRKRNHPPRNQLPATATARHPEQSELCARDKC